MGTKKQIDDAKRGKQVLFFLLLAALVVGNFFQYQIDEVKGPAVDFPSFYYAAHLTFKDSKSPFDIKTWNQVRAEYTEGELSPFLYPPPSLFLFQPLTFFNYGEAKVAMLRLNQLLILAFILIFFFKILKRDASDPFLLLAIVYVYVFYPLFVTLNNGQVSLWLLMCICLVWWATNAKAHPLLIAIPLALAIVLKIFPVLLLSIYLLRKDYKTILYTLGVLAVLVAASAAFLPRGIWADWYDNVGAAGYSSEIRGMPIARVANQSMAAFTTRLFYGLNVRFGPLLAAPPALARLAPYALTVAVLAASAAATWRVSTSKVAKADQFALQVNIWLLAMFLISPFSWQYHLVHLLPAIYLAVLIGFRQKNWAVKIFVIALAAFLAWYFPFSAPQFTAGTWTLLISAQLYGVGLLWAYYMALAARSHSKAARRDYAVIAA
jgi:alpha-1,2-mannosyltransferase